MPEVSLNTLRQLRTRARKLLGNVATDLKPFVKGDGTFRRTPESPANAGDVNVTTTCSCLMALALTDTLVRFYKENPKNTASNIFRLVIAAPWMSSGLTANNAFTTTLVLRTFGFLEAGGFLVAGSGKPDPIGTERTKKWELHLGITDPLGLANQLTKHTDPASEFLWLSLPDKTRNLLRTGTKDPEKLTTVLALDLARIIEGGWIYEAQRFNKASSETQKKLAEQQLAPNPNTYKVAEANYLLLVDQYPNMFAQPDLRSLGGIAESIAGNPRNSFTINKYAASAAVLYWFVDGITRAKFALAKGQWTALCTWATEKFNHEQSLVVAGHDPMMDPIAMGMSASLCALLRTASGNPELGTTKDHLALLPSVVELERAVVELISKQTRTGIWHKYFPMFHYQDAGSNYCFTFELLEAILREFGKSDNTLLENNDFICGLEKAVDWCETYYLEYSDISAKYTGWSSGGDLETLGKEQPESWATAVVHMFLWELVETVSHRIQEVILQKYDARLPKKRTTLNDKPATTKLLDIEVLLKDEVQSLSSVLKTQLIDKWRGHDEAKLRRTPIKDPRSALFFGPPGTAKTEITSAVADDLEWPLVEITPSEFVKGTLANVYLQADEIFRDLMDLSGVVVFFDEMDALVQTRDAETHLDIASQFLTTTMLPKLASLHNEGRVVFFMATNFQDRFDAAVKRAGRFDLLLCMGPPKLSEKLDRLYRVFSLNREDRESAQAIKAGMLIKRYLRKTPELRDRLALYTFGEFKAFLRGIGNKKSIGDRVEQLRASGFRKRLREDSEYVTLNLSDLKPLRKVVTWRNLDELKRKKFGLEQLKRNRIPVTPIIRYLCDWQRSKEQY